MIFMKDIWINLMHFWDCFLLWNMQLYVVWQFVACGWKTNYLLTVIMISHNMIFKWFLFWIQSETFARRLIESLYMSDFSFFLLFFCLVLRNWLCCFVHAAWEIEETIGEDKESERKARIFVPITASWKEAKFHRESQLWFCSSMIRNRIDNVWNLWKNFGSTDCTLYLIWV